MAETGTDAATIIQFERQYESKFQQMVARALPYVRVEQNATGNMVAFGLIDGTDGRDITGVRHGATQWGDLLNTRRWAVRRDKTVDLMLDEGDELSVIVNLRLAYADQAVNAMRRLIDDAIIEAATGTAITGSRGTSTSAYDTTDPSTGDPPVGNQIPSGGAGLTIDKMRTARRIFDQREVGLDDMTMGLRNFVWFMGPLQHQELLEQTEATSTDYLGVIVLPNGNLQQSRMPLVAGRIPHYMGFDLVVSNRLDTVGADRINLAWHKNAMGFARWGAERNIWTGLLPEHNLSYGIIVHEHFGAVRIQDAGVLSILCAE